MKTQVFRKNQVYCVGRCTARVFSQCGGVLMEFMIRPFHPSDLCSIYGICAKTADFGEDASIHHEDPQIIGHYYAGPYAVFEPGLCFVLTRNGVPCGYVLGTRNSVEFGKRCEEEWFPVLRERYPLPSPDDTSPGAEMKRAIQKGIVPPADMDGYPAHLHIDLLADATGLGWGRKLMERFLGRLREIEVPAVHLGVAGKNMRAIAYYRHMGFEVLREHDWGLFMGMRLC
jgi:ribosomal protein S18 acetylase RimI-like enzyme